MSSTKKIVGMDSSQFAVLGILTMYTFIDFVAVMTNSVLRMYPQDGDKTDDEKLSVSCNEGPTDPVWAVVGICIVTLPGVFLMTQTDGPLKEGAHLMKKFWITRKLKYFVKFFVYGIGIICYPAMLLFTQMIAIWQNDTEWFEVVMVLAGLQAVFNSFPHLGLELYMYLNGGERHYSQIVLIVTSFIFLITNAIRLDIIGNKARFQATREKIIYGLKVLPQHATCITFRVMSLVLTFSFIRWYALLPTFLYILEIMILVGYTITADWDVVYNVGLTNIGMTNIGFVKFLTDKKKLPEDLNNRMQKFVRLSSVVTFVHHTVILGLLLILEYYGAGSGKDAGLCWTQITIWSTGRGVAAKYPDSQNEPVDSLSFYLTFNNVIAIGLVNLCLTLYAAKEIEVKDNCLSLIEDEMDGKKTSTINTFDRDLFHNNSALSSNPGSHNTFRSRNGQSPANVGRKDSDTEDEAEQLELV